MAPDSPSHGANVLIGVLNVSRMKEGDCLFMTYNHYLREVEI